MQRKRIRVSWAQRHLLNLMTLLLGEALSFSQKKEMEPRRAPEGCRGVGRPLIDPSLGRTDSQMPDAPFRKGRPELLLHQVDELRSNEESNLDPRFWRPLRWPLRHWTECPPLGRGRYGTRDSKAPIAEEGNRTLDLLITSEPLLPSELPRRTAFRSEIGLRSGRSVSDSNTKVDFCKTIRVGILLHHPRRDP